MWCQDGAADALIVRSVQELLDEGEAVVVWTGDGALQEACKELEGDVTVFNSIFPVIAVDCVPSAKVRSSTTSEP